MNISLLLSYKDKRKNSETKKGNELLRYVGLLNLKDAFPKELSGGEAKRVAIAKVLLTSPDILLADEPLFIFSRNSYNYYRVFRNLVNK